MTKKTIKRASADVGLIYVAFNLRRIFNILSQNELKKYLRELDFNFSVFRTHFKLIYRIVFLEVENIVFEKRGLKVA